MHLTSDGCRRPCRNFKEKVYTTPPLMGHFLTYYNIKEP